jgi:hypothetical protein
MNFAISSGGLVVHVRKDWPCALCRPEAIAEGPGYCLCRSCAEVIMAAAGVGFADARTLLPELTDALTALHEDQTSPASAAN